MSVLSRRDAALSLLSLGFLVGAPACAKAPLEESWRARLAEIEARRGGRIGVAAVDLQSGQTLAHRGEERFAMCSTFKWILGGLVLSRVEAGVEQLNREIEISADDIVMHAPTTGPAVGQRLSVETLCAATIANSDNPAANILLRSLGGPEGFTQALRTMGEQTTRLDRYEPMLNENAPGDPRDTTTPLAMISLMDRMIFGDVLSVASRATLQGWMLAATSGQGRLTAGAPDGWRVGHKTGTSERDANNDVGFALAPHSDRRPVLIASFSDGPGALEPAAETAHADIARVVFEAFLQSRSSVAP